MMKTLWYYISQGMPCIFHEATGLYCPGCGGTRAVKALLRLDFAESFRYHPVVLYTAVVLAVLLVCWILSVRLNKPRLKIVRYELFAYAGVGVILVNWVVKNYCLIVKGVDLLNLNV